MCVCVCVCVCVISPSLYSVIYKYDFNSLFSDVKTTQTALINQNIVVQILKKINMSVSIGLFELMCLDMYI